MAKSQEKGFHGLGRRKTAVAQVLLVSDKDKSEVNNIPFEEYFPTDAMQGAALLPLHITSQQDTFRMLVKVSGGGKQSQADAVQLAVSRALLEVDPGWRKQLREASMLTRDSRKKERKKPGLKRARRAPQFSKR